MTDLPNGSSLWVSNELFETQSSQNESNSKYSLSMGRLITPEVFSNDASHGHFSTTTSLDHDKNHSSSVCSEVNENEPNSQKSFSSSKLLPPQIILSNSPSFSKASLILKKFQEKDHMNETFIDLTNNPTLCLTDMNPFLSENSVSLEVYVFVSLSCNIFI